MKSCRFRKPCKINENNFINVMKMIQKLIGQILMQNLGHCSTKRNFVEMMFN
jgi:hypothetical protein